MENSMNHYSCQIALEASRNAQEPVQRNCGILDDSTTILESSVDLNDYLEETVLGKSTVPINNGLDESTNSNSSIGLDQFFADGSNSSIDQDKFLENGSSSKLFEVNDALISETPKPCVFKCFNTELRLSDLFTSTTKPEKRISSFSSYKFVEKSEGKNHSKLRSNSDQNLDRLIERGNLGLFDLGSKLSSSDPLLSTADLFDSTNFDVSSDPASYDHEAVVDPSLGGPAFNGLDSFDLEPIQPSPQPAAGSNLDSAGTVSSTGLDDDAYERFFRRQRSDTMFELRSLRVGSRSVTDRDGWASVRAFFDASLTTDEDRRGDQVAPSNASRPSHVTDEIDSLSSMRPVTSALQSQAFRQTLEESVFNIVQAVRNSRGQPLPRSYLNGSTVPSVVVNRVPQVGQESSTQLQPEHQSIGSNIASAQNHALTSGNQGQQASAQGQPASNNDGPITVGDQWQRYNNNFLDRLNDPELVNEISQLIQHHVVSSTLRGEFRRVLERTFAERNLRTQNGAERRPNAHAVVGDGPTPENFNARQPRPATVTPMESWDQQRHSMQAEMDEFRRMLRLCMEMQMDVQRSIRQEVAAAINRGNQEGPVAKATSNPTAMVAEGTCVVCLDQAINCVMYDCGHMCACHQCAYSLKADRMSCPICRAPIKDVIVVYRAN